MVGAAQRPRVRHALTRPARWPVTLAPRRGLGGAHARDPGRVRVRRRPPRRRPAQRRFDDELRSAAGELAFEIQLSNHRRRRCSPTSSDVAMAERRGDPHRRQLGAGLRRRRPTRADLGPPEPGVHDVGQLQVATAPIATSQLGLPAVYVQYARDHDDVEATIDRLWLFLAAGVLAGTLLAALAGLVVARRAMRPIAALTAAAREITSTRDPPAHAAPRRRRRGRRARRDPRPDARVARRGAHRARAGDAGASASSSPTPRTSCAPR